MNERPTPETDKLEWATEYCEKVVYSDVARKLERERDELRELYDLDTQFLRAERDEARGLVRQWEDKARNWMDVITGNCRHYKTEREVTQ